MRVEACMSSDVRVVSPTETIRRAAQIMKEIDAGFLPVGENDRLVSMITTATSPSDPWPKADRRIRPCAR